MSVAVPPAAAPQNLLVFMRKIELVPGARWEIPTEFQGSESFIVRRFLDTGTVVVEGSNGLRFTPTAETLLDSSGNPTSIENTGDTNATILELIVSTGETALPEPPSGSRVTRQSVMGYEVASGNGVTFVLARVADPSEYQPGVNSSTHPVIQALVESGSYTFTPNDGTVWSGQSPVATPISDVAQTLDAGEWLHSEPGHFPVMQAEGEGASLLLLGARTITSADIARQGETVSMPSSATPLHLDVRTVTIASGGSYSYTMSGSSIALGISGAAEITTSTSSKTDTIAPGLFSTWSNSGSVTLANSGSSSAVFVLGRVSTASIADGSVDSTTFPQAASSEVTFSGLSSARLSLDTADGRTMQLDDHSASLVLVMNGTLQLRAISDMTAHIASDSVTLTAFGNPVSLSAGDWFFAGPDTSYESTGIDPDTQVIVLELGPDATVTSAIATPTSVSGPPQAGVSLDVLTSDCTVEPRPIEEYERILATPSSTTDLAINHSGDTGAPADPAVVEAVTETMRQLVACNQIDTQDRTYALYSPALLRIRSSSGSFDLSDLSDSATESADTEKAHPAGQLHMGEVVQFSDGRVGAWVVAHGEIAYVTFVSEGGQWLIDFWDDSDPQTTPTP